VLHKDITDEMTLKEVVDLAYSEYKSRLPKSAKLEIKISSDDHGRLMEFIVHGEDNAKMLRDDLPSNYNKMRTIVIYHYDREPDLEDFLF
jgi:hypothetical protein